MTDPNAPLREVRRWMRVSTPVNKAASAGLRGRLPQIAGPLMIGALGVGALGAGIAWRALSSTRGTGRTQRFVDLATATRALDAVTRATWNNPEMAPVSVRARVLLTHDDAGDVEAPGTQTDTVVDMSALGFADEIARPDELYDRDGAPEHDPAWRP